ncbi:MAG TPA: hypothetical protein PLX35_05160 [Cyclobacteriaceae bacterium]|nr:hypothetical protein [Cyclobacteriaceae bacterium]
MKNILIAFMLTTSWANAQTFTETITKELKFEKPGANALMVFNINGAVKVEGYSGATILVEVQKKITGKTTARLEKGKQEIQLGVIDRADTIILYVEGLSQGFGRNAKQYSNSKRGSWGYNWDRHHGEQEKEYDYSMEFLIKVPQSSHVYASTINNGDIQVKAVQGAVYADNINGSIRLTDLSGKTYASTINGSVDVNYVSNPSGDSRYYSLNGDINANFHPGLSAELSFKSFNGEFYSGVDEITSLPVRVEKFNKGDGLGYRVNGNRYKVRNGGPLLDFETFNGDVYLREK